MYSKIFVVVAALMLVEAKIGVPGLEKLQRCRTTDDACVKTSADLINKAIARPFPKYDIKGYDPITIKKIVTDKSQDYQITMELFDLEVTGLGDTKTLRIKREEDHVLKVTYEHNFKIKGTSKFTFHLDPPVVKEGPISADYDGIKSVFRYTLMPTESNGIIHLDLGKEHLVKVSVPNAPVFNKEEYSVLISDPVTKDLVKEVTENVVDFYASTAKEIVKQVSPQFFEDKRNFYKNVPLTDLWTL